MKTLALDTSTPTASIAVTDGAKVLAELSADTGRKRGERLVDAGREILSILELDPSDIEAYAVGVGPGSFTGLRTGLALVKGLHLANPRPAVGVSSLHALAMSGAGFGGTVLPVIEAHKGEVFTAAFRPDASMGLERVSEEMAVAPAELAGLAEGRVLVLGDGLEKHSETVGQALGNRAVIAPPALWSPRAAWIGVLAAARLEKGEADDLDSMVPTYIRHSDAELRLGAKNAGPAS